MAAEYPNLILVISKDDFLLEKRTKEIISDLVPESERDFGLEEIDCAFDTIDAATNALMLTRTAFVQQDFFSTRKTVWMNNAIFLDSKRLQKSENFSEVISGFCDWLLEGSFPEDLTLLISAPSVPKTSLFYKTLSSLERKKLASVIEVSPPTPKTAVPLVLDAAKRMGFEVSREAAEEIVSRAGVSPRILTTEVEKLFLYTNGEKPTQQDIDAICTIYAGGEFWDLTDAFGNHDLKKTLNILHNLFEMRVAPVFLVMQLVSRLNELYLISDSIRTRRVDASGNWLKSLSEEDMNAIAKLGKFDAMAKSSWIFSKIFSQARKWKLSEIRRARTILNTAHERIVSISSDPNNILETAISSALQR
ncbi:MAG: hypothetical protein GX804_04150 [Lentisphaerae bacterium]|jgi:DNA polymerase III delta subunit|nr:hypothetical protein [Lentisphaerota bacterium]